MSMDRRLLPKPGQEQLSKSSELPHDYLEMVAEVFATNFDDGLKALEPLLPGARFVASGRIYPNETMLAVSLMSDNQIAATTVHASCDFDPAASSPTAEDLLASSVDAIASLYQQLITADDPAKLERLAESSLSSFEEIPFEWTPVEVEKKRVYLRVDKSNPQLEQMTDDWLAKNDPDAQAEAEEEQEETQKLFVTGPSSEKKKKPTMH